MPGVAGVLGAALSGGVLEDEEAITFAPRLEGRTSPLDTEGVELEGEVEREMAECDRKLY